MKGNAIKDTIEEVIYTQWRKNVEMLRETFRETEMRRRRTWSDKEIEHLEEDYKLDFEGWQENLQPWQSNPLHLQTLAFEYSHFKKSPLPYTCVFCKHTPLFIPHPCGIGALEAIFIIERRPMSTVNCRYADENTHDVGRIILVWVQEYGCHPQPSSVLPDGLEDDSFSHVISGRHHLQCKDAPDFPEILFPSKVIACEIQGYRRDEENGASRVSKPQQVKTSLTQGVILCVKVIDNRVLLYEIRNFINISAKRLLKWEKGLRTHLAVSRCGSQEQENRPWKPLLEFNELQWIETVSSTRNDPYNTSLEPLFQPSTGLKFIYSVHTKEDSTKMLKISYIVAITTPPISINFTGGKLCVWDVEKFIDNISTNHKINDLSPTRSYVAYFPKDCWPTDVSATPNVFKVNDLQERKEMSIVTSDSAGFLRCWKIHGGVLQCHSYHHVDVYPLLCVSLNQQLPCLVAFGNLTGQVKLYDASYLINGKEPLESGESRYPLKSFSSPIVRNPERARGLCHPVQGIRWIANSLIGAVYKHPLEAAQGPLYGSSIAVWYPGKDVFDIDNDAILYTRFWSRALKHHSAAGLAGLVCLHCSHALYPSDIQTKVEMICCDFQFTPKGGLAVVSCDNLKFLHFWKPGSWTFGDVDDTFILARKNSDYAEMQKILEYQKNHKQLFSPVSRTDKGEVEKRMLQAEEDIVKALKHESLPCDKDSLAHLKLLKFKRHDRQMVENIHQIENSYIHDAFPGRIKWPKSIDRN